MGSPSDNGGAVSAIIFGAGGLGSLVLDLLTQTRAVRVAGWLDSDLRLRGRLVLGLPVFGGLEAAAAARAAGATHAIVAIGDNRTRVALAEGVRAEGFTLLSAVSPLACVAPSAKIGAHVILGARAIVCVHAQIGDHAVVSTGAIVEHDNRIGAGAFLHPAVRLAGGVTVEEFAVLGIGACVTPGRRVGRDAVVEPGSVVIRDVLAGTSVAGVPARRPPAARSHFVAESFGAAPQAV